MNISETHQTIMPYIIMHNADDFIRFTEKVFGAKETVRKLRDNSNMIMHAEIMIGGSTVMFAEATGQWKAGTVNLFIYVEDADSTYNKALAAGASSLMPPADQDYGRSCGITDPFGNTWWITGKAA